MRTLKALAAAARLAIIAIVVLTGSPALACTFDSDCKTQLHCYRASGGIFGICAGELVSSASDERRARDKRPDTSQRTHGKACNFDTECAPGSVCAKSVGATQGLCRRGR